MASKKTKSDRLKELDIALENRAFEIQLFWQRSNYFLVLITALGIGAIAVDDNLLALIITVFGTITSFLWFRTNLGSRFWQESWEVEVNELAEKLGVTSFERPMKDIKEQVRQSLKGSKKQSFFRRWVDQQIVKKPSVSYHMIILSIVSIAIWLCAFLFFLVQILIRVWPAVREIACTLSPG
ncbi:hypothetical protein [Parasphingorhabdus sp.]|uniref:RipA family octameric membrane protein n=1 Tax=Parasphingorhabdus sp. TaxID=2709688 RepID=UPI00326769DB